MPASLALRLCCQLAVPQTRAEAAAELARELGAEHCLVFILDEEVEAFVPAPGFPQTLPGGPAWSCLLERCRASGAHVGDVAYPTPDRLTRAHAWSLPEGLLFMLLGGEPRPLEPDALALPLLATALRAESANALTQRQLTAEREVARHATALASALDKARWELEAVLSESARLNRELAAAAKERAALLASEQSASRAKDEFLAMLGHELRNPLAPIVTALQLLKLRGGPTLPRELSVIERQVAHLGQLVDDLLDVSRITRGVVVLKRARVELSVVAHKAVEMAGPLLEQHHHRLTVEVPERGLLLDADERRMAQVISNLLTNAARYTPPGGEVSLTAAREGARIVVRVRDNGMGIEPSMLRRIFDLFVQGERSKDRGGLGLGLCIVSNLVTLHGGFVEARSAGLGMGSEFVVDLPAAQLHVVEEPAQASPGWGRPPLRAKGTRVLVVDDNEDAAELLTEALRLHGYEVACCNDGPGALEAVGRFAPDVAILDIGLPVMDGVELARRLRGREDLPRLRLIAATGYGQEADRALTRDAGFEHHLVKPIRVASLVELIEGAPEAA
ncbi:hypothetical protein DRW03_09065 [Corallococcus sp. H22C18031201]|nr:hypothetical protein DRW03_09065 [Corallococcus sp. H22C18031201]